MLARLLFLFSLLGTFFPAAATTYYVSSTGNDAHAGTSPGAAWRSTEPVNRTSFRPGDRVLFEGGKTFEGNIWLRSQGSARQPIIFSSFGRGRASISSGKSFGFYAHNVGGIEVRNLNFVGAGRLTNTNSGVIFYLDSANVHLEHLILDSVDVQGYQAAGISIGSWKGTSGYNNVRITACKTSANGEAGLSSYAQELAAHHNWYVGYCQAFDNSGRSDITNTHTGNGIVLSGIDGALIEHCEAYNNGWLNGNPQGGPVGIWGWCCNNLVIQMCESHHNRTGTTKDGGGFDLDGGCTNSVLQYNYSHDNDGPGYLLAQYPAAPPLRDVVIRYNISENDGRKHNQGALLLWSSGANGGIQRAAIHNNTIFLSPPADGSQPKAIDITSDGISDITFRNNVVMTTGGLPVVAAASTQGTLFQGNAYWSDSRPLSIRWGASSFASLEAWRAASNQETMAGRPTGLYTDPLLQNPGKAGTIGQLSAGQRSLTLNAYELLAGSSLLGAGLDLQKEFGLAPGPRDFAGVATPPTGAPRNIGAFEPAQKVLSARPLSSEGWCSAYPNPAHETLRLAFAAGAPGAAPTEVRLYDLLGRVRVHQTNTGAAAELTIPLTELGPGRYQLEVRQANRRYSQAVLVQ